MTNKRRTWTSMDVCFTAITVFYVISILALYAAIVIGVMIGIYAATVNGDFIILVYFGVIALIFGAIAVVLKPITTEIQTQAIIKKIKNSDD